MEEKADGKSWLDRGGRFSLGGLRHFSRAAIFCLNRSSACALSFRPYLVCALVDIV